MPGGRPRKSTEGIDEKTLKAREKATNYAEKKRMELESLKLEIMDCQEDLKKMKEMQKEIKKDIKMYDNYDDIKLSSLFNSPAPSPKAAKKVLKPMPAPAVKKEKKVLKPLPQKK